MPPCDSQVSALSLVRSSHWSQILTCTSLPNQRPTHSRDPRTGGPYSSGPGPHEGPTIPVLVAKASYGVPCVLRTGPHVATGLSTFTMPVWVDVSWEGGGDTPTGLRATAPNGLFTCSPAATCCRRTNHSPATPVLPDACPSCLLVLSRDVALLCSHRRQETNGESETSR
jgi:hypothetical protein